MTEPRLELRIALWIGKHVRQSEAIDITMGFVVAAEILRKHPEYMMAAAQVLSETDQKLGLDLSWVEDFIRAVPIEITTQPS